MINYKSTNAKQNQKQWSRQEVKSYLAYYTVEKVTLSGPWGSQVSTGLCMFNRTIGVMLRAFISLYNSCFGAKEGNTSNEGLYMGVLKWKQWKRQKVNSGLSGHSKLLKGAFSKPTRSALTASYFHQPTITIFSQKTWVPFLHFLHWSNSNRLSTIVYHVCLVCS